MKKKPQWIKSAKTHGRIVKDGFSAWLKKAGGSVKKKAAEIDNQLNVSKHVDDFTKRGKRTAKDFDERYAVSKKTKVATEVVITNTARGVKTVAQKLGLKEKAVRFKNIWQGNVIKPIVDLADEHGVTKKIGEITEGAAGQYGKTRAWIKPYYAPESPNELLRNTKRELVYINACILQISYGEAEKLANKLGAAIVSKIAGVTSVSTLLGMVSTFGTASTGTAIASLHGAAASNATLYWVGSLLGGGMATGALLTGGAALVVGISVYKLLGSEARQYEELSEHEKRIVEATGFLIAAINDTLAAPGRSLDVNEADLLLQNTLRPLHQQLMGHSDEISENLDKKHKILFRQHALLDFEKTVLDGFEFFIAEEMQSRRRYPEFVIAGVFYALLTQSVVDESRESQLALSSIRRMKTEWHNASESELSSALKQYEPEQLRGVANNAKGIYHEMLFVDDYNHSHEASYAELFTFTNRPGADVQIRSHETGEVLEEIQLKATSDEQLVTQHYEKYPDINVLATDEIATKLGLAKSTAISNAEITEKMDRILDDVSDNTISDRTEESAELAGLIAAGRGAIQVLRGNQNISNAGRNTAKAAAVAATSTALVAYLFS